MSTNILSIKDIKRDWHLVDAKGQILGRLATEVASKLTGKHKPYYVPYQDCGDYVVVTNAAKVQTTGKKELQKRYVRHSGYPGGLRVETLTQLRSRRPEEIIRRAVLGMLPKTKLGRKMIKKLYVFVGSEHKFDKQFKSSKEEEI